MTVQELARTMYEALERRTRDNGEAFYTFRDGSPEWMTDAAHAAHGDMFPDDWRYDAIHSALEHIADANDTEDGADEFADGATDVYNSALYAWLASHGARSGYVNEAREELGAGDSLEADLMRGQYSELRETYTLLLEALTEREDED